MHHVFIGKNVVVSLHYVFVKKNGSSLKVAVSMHHVFASCFCQGEAI